TLRRPRRPAHDPNRTAPCRAGPACGCPRCTRSARDAASPVGAPSWHRLQVHRHDGAVAPEPVEGVEVALVLVLDVHHDVDVVEQRPPTLAGTFAAGGLVSGEAHLLLDL